jgi:hypothetical protein
MAIAMVRRRIAGYAKVKRKRAPLPKKSNGPDDGPMVGEAVRVYAPMAAVGRSGAPRSQWQKLWKPVFFGSGLLVGCIVAFLVMKSPSRSYSPAPERQDYPKTSPLSASRVVGASAARRSGPTTSSNGQGNVGGGEMVVLVNRNAPTDDSFRAGAYVRQKVFLPNASGDCVVSGGSDDIGDCLRRQAAR